MFKKPNLTNYTAGTNKSDKKLYSPTFEKRKPSNKVKQTKNYSGGVSNKSRGKKLYSPTFAKRKTDNTVSKLQGKYHNAKHSLDLLLIYIY